jgi:tetratricopeptide (TPR) repeat protein
LLNIALAFLDEAEAAPASAQAQKVARAEAYLLKANLYIRHYKQPETGLQLLAESRQLCLETHHGLGLLQYINDMGMYYWLQNDPTAAKASQKLLISYAKQLGNLHQATLASYNLASMEILAKNLEEGLHLVEEALQLATRLNLHDNIGFCYSSLAEVLLELGRPKEAARYGWLGLRYVKEYPNKIVEGDLRRNYGYALLKLGKLEESEQLSKQGLEDSNTDAETRLRLYANLVQIYCWQSRWENALNSLATLQQTRAEVSQAEYLIDSYIAQFEFELSYVDEQGPVYWEASLLHLNELMEQANTAAVFRLLPLMIMRGRMLIRLNRWEEAEADFKQAVEMATLEKRGLLLAEAYYWYSVSLLTRLKNNRGERQLGLRPRAVGMLAQAIELNQQAEALLEWERAANLLKQARSSSTHLTLTEKAGVAC